MGESHGRQTRQIFSWCNGFNPKKLNSADAGPFDTEAVGQYPQGTSPYGLLGGAGQVYEWTATTQGAKRSIVKGAAHGTTRIAVYAALQHATVVQII